jgi:hypothetical protein
MIQTNPHEDNPLFLDCNINLDNEFYENSMAIFNPTMNPPIVKN